MNQLPYGVISARFRGHVTSEQEWLGALVLGRTQRRISLRSFGLSCLLTSATGAFAASTQSVRGQFFWKGLQERIKDGQVLNVLSIPRN